MDIYQIFITHNRIWSIREAIRFSAVMLFALALGMYLKQKKKSNNVSGYFRVACIIVLGNSFWLNSFHKKSRNKKIRIGAILVMEGNFWNRTSWQISIRESGFVIAGECFKYVSADAIWNAASIHF